MKKKYINAYAKIVLLNTEDICTASSTFEIQDMHDLDYVVFEPQS